MTGRGTATLRAAFGAVASRTQTGQCRRVGQRFESGVLTRQRESAPTSLACARVPYARAILDWGIVRHVIGTRRTRSGNAPAPLT